jgi:hypothetical protein
LNKPAQKEMNWRKASQRRIDSDAHENRNKKDDSRALFFCDASSFLVIDGVTKLKKCEKQAKTGVFWMFLQNCCWRNALNLS